MNCKHISSTSTMKITLEEEIITTADPRRLSTCNSYLHSWRVNARGLFWHSRVTTQRIAMEACMESRLPPHCKTDPTLSWSQFQMLWIKTLPSRNITALSFFKRRENARGNKALSQKAAKERAIPLGLPWDVAGLMQHLYQLERGDEQNITPRTGCCPLLLFHLQISMGTLLREGVQHREKLELQHPISYFYPSAFVKYFATSSHPVLLETVWFAILTTYKGNHNHRQSWAPWIWNCVSNATSVNGKHKILHGLKLIMRCVERLFTVLSLIEPDL